MAEIGPHAPATQSGRDSDLSSLPETPTTPQLGFDDRKMHMEAVAGNERSSATPNSAQHNRQTRPGRPCRSASRPLSQSSQRKHSTKRPRAYRSRTTKLKMVLDFLQNVCNMTFAEFLDAWMSDITLTRCGRYDHPKGRRNVIRKLLSDPEFVQACGIEQDPGPDVVMDRELSALIAYEPFGTWNANDNFEGIDYVPAYRAMQEHAPTWTKFLHDLLSNQRSSRDSYEGGDKYDRAPKKAFMATAAVCYSRAADRSNCFPFTLAVYLQASGVKPQVIDVLSGFGICLSYNELNNVMGQVVAASQRPDLGLDGSSSTPMEWQPDSL